MNFSGVRVRYEYDFLAKTHFIEVVPNEIYHLDDKYIQWESNMFDSFTDLYPDQNICFLSDDSIVSIEDASDILYGKAYSSVPTEQKTISIHPDRYSSPARKAVGH